VEKQGHEETQNTFQVEVRKELQNSGTLIGLEVITDDKDMKQLTL